MMCLIVLALLCPMAYALGNVQSAAVKGVLFCDKKPMADTKVKLYDVDTLDPDDLMDEGRTDSQGRFQLSGKESEYTTIDPKVNIYHNCNYKPLLLQRCLKKVSIGIPKEYVTQGEKPARVFDAGVINLAGKFGDESTDCIN